LGFNKGFTQNCTASDESCTNSYQQDRVVLKRVCGLFLELGPHTILFFEQVEVQRNSNGLIEDESQVKNYDVGQND
jgi:hypothetical protein